LACHLEACCVDNRYFISLIQKAEYLDLINCSGVSGFDIPVKKGWQQSL
jgi:hypothetical protein